MVDQEVQARAATRPAPSAAFGRSPVTRLLIVAVMLIGAGLRLWSMFRPSGVLDSDVAVVGLMGRHLLHNHELHVFFWGQAYGGIQEAMAAAAVFVFLGSTAFALKLSTALLSGIVAVLVWRVGRATVGEPAATVGGLLFWVWPAGFVWWSVKPGSTYWTALALALAGVLILLRIRRGEADSPWWFLLFGAVVGFGWWANPQVVYVLAPAGVYAASALIRSWRRLPFALAGFVAGAGPWIAFNVRHNWASLDFPSHPSQGNSYLDHLRGFFKVLLPMALGVREPFSRAWFHPPIGQILLVVAVLAFALVLLRRPSRLRLPLLMALMFPFLLSISQLASYVDQPRYALFILPALALLIGTAIARPKVWVVGLAGAIALTAWGINGLNKPRVAAAYAPDVTVPANDHDLLTLLKDRGVRYAYGDYWLAYRVSYETRERVIVSPTYSVRYQPYARKVRAHPEAAYMFVTGSKTIKNLLDYCQREGIPAEVHRRGGFTLVEPGRQVLPDQVGNWT